MSYLPASKNILIVFASVIIALVAGRVIRSHYDFSYFITAGSDFVDSSKTTSPITIRKGQGYDGQFFYRYALNPFNFSKTAYGVTVDHPPYRLQRIAYPFFAWLLSFGGVPSTVPVMLVLINILAFLGIAFFTVRFIIIMNGNPVSAYLPLLLAGIYMSLARDLSEVTEAFFF